MSDPHSRQLPILHALIVNNAPTCIINYAVDRFPHSIITQDSFGQYPIDLAVQYRLAWDGGLQDIVDAYASSQQTTTLHVCAKHGVKLENGTKEVLVDALKRCFKILPAHRVLVIVLAEEISWELISAVEEARGQRRPLVVDRKSKANSFNSNQITQIREYDCFVQKWLVDLEKTQDLIASSCVIAGFEWPSVLMITNVNHPSQFYACNMVMRAMSRLVWLKTNSIDEVNELGMPFPRTSLFPGFRGGGAFDSPGFRGGGVFDFDLGNFTSPKIPEDSLTKKN